MLDSTLYVWQQPYTLPFIKVFIITCFPPFKSYTLSLLSFACTNCSAFEILGFWQYFSIYLIWPCHICTHMKRRKERPCAKSQSWSLLKPLEYCTMALPHSPEEEEKKLTEGNPVLKTKTGAY